MTKDTVKFCPTCASSYLQFSELVGGDAGCLGCGWRGKTEELLLVPIQHDFAFGKESIISEMMLDVRRMLSGELGLPYLKFLMKWGFLEGDVNNLSKTLDRKKFAKYLSVIGHAVLSAMILERMKQGEGKALQNKETSDGAAS